MHRKSEEPAIRNSWFINYKASFISTLIAEFIMLPVTTIKTVYQTTKNKSIFQSANNIYMQRGIKGFYRSGILSMTSQSISTSTKFVVYSYTKSSNDWFPHNILSSITAGIVACTIVHPINVIKQHQERGIDFFEKFKSSGYPIFYRGYTKALTLSTLLTLSFPVYDKCRQHIQNPAFAAALSSVIVTSCLQPIDLMKIRSMAAKKGEYKFYRGFHINLIRSVPHFVMTMVFIEHFKKTFSTLDEDMGKHNY